jgi:hypothetical protein
MPMLLLHAFSQVGLAIRNRNSEWCAAASSNPYLSSWGNSSR